MFEIQSTKTTKWEFVVKELNQAKGAATALDTETKVKICGDKNVCNASFSVRLITGDAPHLHSTLRSNRHIDCTVTVRLLYKDKPPPSLRSTNANGASALNAVLRQLTCGDEFPEWNYKQMQIRHLDWLRFVWLVWAVAVIFICEGKAVSHLHIARTSSPIFQKAASQDSFGRFQQLDGCRTDFLCSSHPWWFQDILKAA